MPATGEFQFPTLGSTAQDTTVNAAVKARYEANANTNAYTDAEKAKLAALNSASYATSAQGAKADTALQPSGSPTSGQYLKSGGGTLAGGQTGVPLTDVTGRGTAAALNVPATPGAAASSSEVVRGDDPRLSGGGSVDDTAYAGSWDGVTGVAPSKNAVYDKLQTMAPLASPALTGTPTAPTAAAGTSTTQVATTAFVAASFEPLMAVSVSTAASITLADADNRKFRHLTNASPAITIPAGLAVGAAWSFSLVNGGTATAASGVTLNGVSAGSLTLSPTPGAVTFIVVAPNTVIAIGQVA